MIRERSASRPSRAALALLPAIGALAGGPPAASAQTARPGPERRLLSEAVAVDFAGSCVDRDALTGRVARWLGRDDVDARLSITARGRERPLSASFEVRREGRVIADRRFDDVPGACDDLVSALALAIALAIDATVLDRASPAPPREAPGLAALGSDAAARAPRPRPTIALQPAWLFGVLPTGVVALGLDGELAVASRVVAGMGLGVTGESRAPLGPGEVKTRLFRARAFTCAAGLQGRWQPRACLGLSAGPVAAAGADFDTVRTDLAFWAAGTGRLEARLRVSADVSLSTALEGFLSLARPSLDLAGPDGRTVASRRLPAAGASLGAGIAWRL